MGKHSSYRLFTCRKFRKESRKGKITIDELRAPLVKKLFEEYATGCHTLAEMVIKANEWGLRNSRGNQGNLCISHIHSIIQIDFTTG